MATTLTGWLAAISQRCSTDVDEVGFGHDLFLS
jgi:hypothetical protein